MPKSADTSQMAAQIYADNDFQLWVNGAFVVRDPIPVMPHNTVSVSFPISYPLTIAIRADDTADPMTGLEYDNSKAGDAGLVARFGNGAGLLTGTGPDWRCIQVFSGPSDLSCPSDPSTCTVTHRPIPEGWYTPGFDDSGWDETTLYDQSAVRPDGDFGNYDWTGAKFIWTRDLVRDNTVLCRLTLQAPVRPAANFSLESPAVTEGGALPAKYTCDGASATLPLNWRGAPAGTTSYAVVMHHVPGPGDTHWYWVLYDLPVTTTSLAENVTGIGMLGTNSVNDKPGYSPPCSKGPGPKQYTYTVYALSAPPVLSVPATRVNRAVLLEAIKDRTLASAELNVIYSR